MNEQVKKLWLAALRSGEYTQGRHQLRKGKGLGSKMVYCCLGVLTELYRQSVGSAEGHEWQICDSGGYTYIGNSDLLPIQVAVWAGLPNENPKVFIGDGETTFASLNDNGASLEEIADIIEEKF